MSNSTDMKIKLFGRTITSLFSVNHYDPSSGQTKEDSSSSSSSCSPSIGPERIQGDESEQDNSKFKDPYTLTDLNEPPKAVSEISSPSEITSTSVDKSSAPLKKPDKILPCPRCESANTKFCYYNNYNVNQPRYFCRNCQRYWTAGGSMRNVPVGSGRRKHKGWPSSHSYLQVTSDQDYDDDNNNNNSGTILSFASSESSVTETVKYQSGDTKINAESPSHKGFLPPQVMSSPWPYQWSPNANFYPIPVYWGCTVPLWPTSETSPSLRKRSRDHQASVKTKEGINGTSSTNSEPISEGTKRLVWSKLPTKPEKKTQGVGLFDGFETKGSNKTNLVPETSLNLQANPAAMSRSMNFRESMK